MLFLRTPRCITDHVVGKIIGKRTKLD